MARPTPLGPEALRGSTGRPTATLTARGLRRPTANTTPIQLRLPPAEVKAIKLAAVTAGQTYSDFMLACFHACRKASKVAAP